MKSYEYCKELLDNYIEEGDYMDGWDELTEDQKELIAITYCEWEKLPSNEETYILDQDPDENELFQKFYRDFNLLEIKEIRTSTNMTQKKFSEYLNIPMRTIQHWETGTRTCPDYVLELIKFKIEKEVHSMNTMYVITITYGYDESVEFYKTKEEAITEAQDRWNHMNDTDKKRNKIIVGKCDTCHINEDGIWDYVEKDGGALCDLKEIYLEL